MADGLCTEDGTLSGKAENMNKSEYNKSKMFNMNDSGHNKINNQTNFNNQVKNNSGDNNLKSESFTSDKALVYIDSDSGQLCSFQYSSNKSVEQFVSGSSSVIIPHKEVDKKELEDMPSPSSINGSCNGATNGTVPDCCNTNKKRCVDRYDSSESSDRYVFFKKSIALIIFFFCFIGLFKLD